MGKKVIRVGLSESEIDKAIKEVKQYKRDMIAKFNKFRKRLADEIASDAQLGFNSSTVDDVIRGGTPHQADVIVRVDDQGTISIIVADGEDAVWCEFGAGVYHNGAVGSSPNPLGSELGFTIGSYGKGYGKATAWGYYDNGELVITRGTPATMPMYNAIQSVTIKAIQIAKEVWG